MFAFEVGPSPQQSSLCHCYFKSFVFLDSTKIDVPLACGPMITGAKLMKFTLASFYRIDGFSSCTQCASEPTVHWATHIKPHFPTPSASIHICETASPPQCPVVPRTLDGAQKLPPTPNTLVITGHWAARFNSVGVCCYAVETGGVNYAGGGTVKHLVLTV